MNRDDGLPRCPQHGVAASQLFLLRKQYQKEVLLLSPPENRLFLPLKLAAAMKQIKRTQRSSARKRWKMNSPKKPLNMDGQKVDSARALIALDGE
nr:hypothetical protein [Escherichia coli]